MVGSVVVLGSGMAGLAAALVLAEHAERVTVIDRDHLPDAPAPRAGVPQSRHVHTLLLRGATELEVLVPGLEASLEQHGALRLDWTLQHLRSTFGWAPREPSGLIGTFCTRDLLEYQLRQAVLQRPQVRILSGTEAVGLLGSAERVRGVVVRERGADGPAGARSGSDSTLEADLVVDACGRSSRSPQWLAALGCSVPAETVVASQLGYASRVVRRHADAAHDGALLTAVRSDPPSTRGGVVYPVEGDRFVITLAGIGEDVPPHDDEGFRAFARSLPGDVGDAVDGEPVTRIATYRRTQNRWRHWERGSPAPLGFLAVGDAVCCFNPVYGQGMTVAALHAAALNEHLRHEGLDSRGLHHLRRRIAAQVPDAWALATLEDFRYAGTVGRRPPSTRAAHWYADRVLATTVRDAVVHRRFLEVAQLVRPRRDLAAPAIAARVLAA
jgi:2-polyprenyl-6-methoxyphenol hydroxylase-like FAD-dependent oxidoreductase